jgi:hypothetical protein
MLYNSLLLLHSWDRWAIIVLGILLVGSAKIAWLGRTHQWTPAREKLSLFFIIALDIQLLLGLGLYLITPWFNSLMNDAGAVMGDRVARFWAVEHIFGMLIAIILAHVGRVSVKKTADAHRRNFKATMYFGITMLIILVTMPWPFLAQGRPLFRLGF